MDNFPFLPRIKCLLMNNNRVCRIGENLEESLPALDTVVFTNNNVQELADIETLSTCKNIRMISFLHNPVVAKPNYRLFVIHKFPELKVGIFSIQSLVFVQSVSCVDNIVSPSFQVLDFKKVKQKERDAAKALFKSKQGKDQLKEIKRRAKTFVPGQGLPAESGGGRPVTNASGLTPEQVRNIKSAIARATSLEEIERLNQMLRTGQIPGETPVQGRTKKISF